MGKTTNYATITSYYIERYFKMVSVQVNMNTKENPSIPGKAPARADHELSETELDRRNRRRARNREAATRQRQKREARVQMLEAEIEKLKSDRGNLSKQNIELKKMIEQLKYQITNQQQQQQVFTVKQEYQDGQNPVVIPVYASQQPTQAAVKRESSGSMEELMKLIS